MDAAEVRSALHGRWPDERYLHIEEAPLNHYRQGNKIDVLIIDQWQSGKHQTEAIEVKVSYSDWTREWRRSEWILTDFHGKKHEYRTKPGGMTLATYMAPMANRYGRSDPVVPDDFEPTVERVQTVCVHKNQDWRLRAHRFWIAAPADLAKKIAADCETVPELADWGVLAVREHGTDVLRKPKTTMPKEWGHSMWLGIVRSAADAGPNALLRSYNAGYQAARKLSA